MNPKYYYIVQLPAYWKCVLTLHCTVLYTVHSVVVVNTESIWLSLFGSLFSHIVLHAQQKICKTFDLLIIRFIDEAKIQYCNVEVHICTCRTLALRVYLAYHSRLTIVTVRFGPWTFFSYNDY